MNTHPTTRFARSGHGAACALTLALIAGLATLANVGIAVVAKRPEGPAPVALTMADPTAQLLDAVRNGSLEPTAARAEFAKLVPALAAVASSDNDPRQAEAIVALGLAGTDEACAALRAIVDCGSPADAELALAALASASHACAIP
ncbi:MAG: hypothetical protein AAB074_16315 [Planctomycetota bacterium]